MPGSSSLPLSTRPLGVAENRVWLPITVMVLDANGAGGVMLPLT